MRVTFLNCNVDDVTLAESVVKIEEIIKKNNPVNTLQSIQVRLMQCKKISPLD